MEPAADDLLAALSSPCSGAGIHARFAAYLQPFSPYLLAANPNNPRPPPKRMTKQPTQQPTDAAALRGHYARAEAEAAATLDALRCALSPTPMTALGAASLLPEPAGVAGEDPEITTLAVELTVCLANCASKGKVKEAAPYQRLLVLVDQLRPWLRILTEESSRKHLTLLVNALSRCAIFLAAESLFFNEKLVHKFCVATLQECEKPQMIEHLPAVARVICSSVDLSWGGSTHLLLGVLKIAVSHVKDDLPKAVNEFLKFVAYFFRSFLSSNRNVHAGASELLLQGDYFPEISAPIASVLHLYATVLRFSTQQIKSEDHLTMAVNFLKNEKNHADVVWENFSKGKTVPNLGNMTCVLMALDQFIDSSFVENHNCTKRSEEEEERLHKQRVTLMNTLVSAIKISFVTNEATQAPKALELCCQTTWAYARLSYCRLSARTEGHIITEDLPKDTLKDIITAAFARITKMVGILDRCGSKAIRGIIVKSLSEFFVYGDTSDYHESYLALIKLWVKELLAYGESRVTMLCANMQHRIVDILLNEIYCSKEYYLDRSKVLVRKACILRGSGVQNISNCLESLSEAISLLQGILLDSSQGNAIVIHELAIAYCLHAHCAQEANHGGKVIFDNARSVVGLWSKMGTFDHCSPGGIFQQQSKTLVPLLCSLVDLLAMKRLWPVDFFSQSCEHSFGNQFGFNASVDEIDKVASSLVSEGPSGNQSTYLAGCIYYDLSERLLSRGQVLQAISYGREALQLRKKLLKKKFKFNLGKFVSGESQYSGGQGFVSLEAWGPTMAGIWPDCTRPSSMRDSFLTPWNVLRCYLESILQVAVMHELVGNGAEAEVLLRIGKEISCFQGLPIFAVVFTSVLGQIYHKRLLWDAAEGELKHAKDLLAENDEFISCKTCKLTLQISVDVQAGDLSWNLFEKDLQKQSTGNLSSALGMYQSAVEKLNNSGLDFSAGSCDKVNTSCMLCSKDSIAETKRGACNNGKEPLAAKDGVLPPCTPCLLFSQVPIDQYDELVGLKSERENLKSAESAPPLDVKVKRASGTSLRLAKEQNVSAHAKTRTTRSSKRTAHVKSEKDLAELNSKNDISYSKELSTDGLVCGKLNCSLDGVGRNRDDICNMFGCWSCLFVNSLNFECIENILQFREDCIRRRHLVSLLLKTARTLGAQGGKHGAHEVHSIYWQCISLLYFRSLPQGCYRTYGPRLVELIMNENTGDFLSLERAEILCSMSSFLLKGFLSEQSRDGCCSFCSVQMSDVVSWLLKAFVLSGESPSLLQEVCRLLTCIFLLSTIDSTVQLPLYSKGSLSLNHWAAYFHQTSVGTYLNCHYLASLQALHRKTESKGVTGDLTDKTDEVPKFLRFSSAGMEHLEKHVIEFFHELPDLPIVCISMLGGDIVNVLGETLLLPSPFPAWMLISRFDSTNKPTTMLLPVDPISKEAENGDSSIKELDNPTRTSDKEWKCPWSYTIIDYVAPTFKKLLEDNFRSLSGATHIPEDGKANTIRWWSDRMKLNDDLSEMLENIEELWLGPWKCLLLGHQLADQHSKAVLENLITALESEFKLEVDPALIKVILGGVASVDELKECVSQLISYKSYFGRGGCCGRDRLRAFCCQTDGEALVTLEHLCNGIVDELSEPIDRNPVILVLDTDVQCKMLPWENLPALRNQEIYRMPSMRSIFLALTRSTNHHKDASAMAPPFPVIDPFDAFYLLNPSGDLISTQEEFYQLFRNYEWKGNAGDAPTAEELVLALRNHDLFLYFGHGSGSQYVSGKEIEKLDNCAAALLMGCSSGTLHCKGGYAPQGAPLSYLFAGSPSVIANLWDVLDKDIDRFSKALLNSWLQEKFKAAKNCPKCCRPLTQEFESTTIAAKDNGRPRRKGDIGSALIDAATVVESFSASLSDSFDMAYNLCRSSSMHARCWQHRCVPSSMTFPRAWQAWCGASSTSSSSVYACPVLATLVRAFVYNVSPGLANPPRCVVNNVFFPAHHYFDTIAPMLTHRPFAPAAPWRHPRYRLPDSTSTTTFFAQLPRPRLHHPRLSATSTNDTKGYRLLEQPRWFPLQPRLRDASTVTTVGGVRRLAFGFFSSLTVCVATVVTAGGC
ncbi:Separin [Triticum urartu]|uniref:separase n=1 Tax=Triticum urartu TaxID=4572 RepID=M8A0A1_TRIUA|nr:Separin [Triticum urartu]